MAEFKLGRIRFVWKGDWTSSTTYYQDDVVALGGKMYICVIGHDSSESFFTDLDITPSKWNLVSEGQTWKGDWQTETSYIYDDIVKYGGRLYICNTNHTSAATTALGLEANQNDWTLFSEGLDWKGAWTVDTRYKVNDFVKYGGSSYVCNTAHTSASTETLGLETDILKWDLLNQGLDYRNSWTPSTRYKINDIVRYGASSWIAITAHTSTDDFGNDITNWEKFAEGFQYEDEWNYENNYQPGDIVRYGGNQYIAITDNNNIIPPANQSDWNLFSEGLKFLGDWGEDSSAFEYKIGEVVRLGGYTYRCILDHQNQQPPNTTYWERLNSGFDWRGAWQDDQEYFEGDVVRYGDNSYVCLLGHISEGDDFSSLGGAANSRPDLDATGVYWNIFAVGSEQSVLTTTGDLVYYSGAAPQRLPIGVDGQVLTVSENGIPEWAFLGATEDVYYVAEHGRDQPAPIYGQSIDRPWRSVRYATQQIDRGAKNPGAKRLIELNRKFIQREITEWVDYQISTAGPGDLFENLDYNAQKCERDMGYIVDALVWDISHGGNVRSREAALSYINDTVGSPYLTQKAQTVAAINYGLDVIEAVLSQTAPDVNYQVLNGDNSTAVVQQYTDATLRVESVLPTITSLVEIITDAITAGNANSLPERRITNNLIRVSTGKFYEVLPIIVPAETCIIGDELRSAQVIARKSSNSVLTPKSDFKYSFKALERIEEIVGDVVTGVSVTPTTGNVEAQDQTWPYAETTVVAPQVTKLARSIRKQIDSKLGLKEEAILTPVYEMSNTNNGLARDLFLANKEFIQAEIIAYITDEYPNIKYSRTKCKQDVGFIMDAVAYDLTYGGNWQSVIAGEAYFNGSTGVLQIDSTEKTATLAAYGYLKALLQTVGRNISVTPLYQTTVEQIPGTGSDSSTATTIGNLLDDIVDIITNGVGTVAITYPTITNSDANTAISALDSAKSTIQETTIDFINKNFGSFRYNSAVCRRDLRNILTDVAFDVALGTNYNAVFNGIAYTRPTNAYNIANQRIETIGAIRNARNLAVDELSDSTAITRATAAFNEIVDILDNGTVGTATPGDGVVDALSFPAPNTLPTTDASKAFDNLVANRDFIIADVVAYVNDNTPPVGYDQTKCARDVGYIVDALCYDVLYGGTMAISRITESYFGYSGVDGVSGAVYPAGQVTETVAAYGHLSTIAQAIVREQDVTPQTSNTTEIQTKLGDPAGVTEAGVVSNNMTILTNALTAGDLDSFPAVVYPNLVSLNVSATLRSEKTAIDSARAQIILDTIQYISDTYNDFNFNHAKCSRDIGLILDAAKYDFGLGTNFASMVAAYSYLRAPSNNVIKDQKTASIAAFEYARQQFVAEVPAGSTYDFVRTGINDTWEWVDDVIFGGSSEGGNRQVDDEEVYNAIRMLELNKEFIVSEALAYVDDYFQDTVLATDSVANTITVNSTDWLDVNMPIKFTNPDDSTDAVGNASLTPDITFYVREIVDGTKFKVSTTVGGTVYSITQYGEGFTVEKVYQYNRTLCARDVREYVEAIKWDLTWPQEWKREYTDNISFYRPASYKTRLAARYYANSVLGSQEEDMYYLRNGTGVRNQTVDGLQGDLTPENAFGTSRPTAGAYASLDPGWGPDDERVWISARSPYVQNVTTFGYAAIGQKIDGSLHNGGNDSIVSNDFTQVISDGIGAWITNNGRAELVSVFTYYSYIGYLAENGGRIRATNGNNSYGTFGSVAEGTDSEEVPITAVVDNKTQYNATIARTNTDASQVFNVEFSHAGNDYTEATIEIFGPGENENVVADEFRDNGVFQVRITEVDDSTGNPDATAGGSGYTYVSNTAQSGSATGIFLAATDGNLSSAYPGMRVVITGGAGIGLYGTVYSYDSGSKEAVITKPRFGVEPLIGSVSDSLRLADDEHVHKLSVGMPVLFTGTTLSPTIEPDTIYYVVEVTSTGFKVSATSGGSAIAVGNTSFASGSVSVYAAGWDHFVPGWPFEAPNASSTYLIEPAIDFSAPVKTTATRTLAGATTYSAATYFETSGVYTNVPASTESDGSGVTFDITRNGSKYYVSLNSGGSGYQRLDTVSIHGSNVGGEDVTHDIIVTVTTVNAVTGAIVEFDFDGLGRKGKFIALPSSGTTASVSFDGVTWAAETLPSSGSGTWSNIAHGLVDDGSSTYKPSIAVAVCDGSSNVAYSVDGDTWSTSTLPGGLNSADATDVAYGNVGINDNRFVVISAADRDTAYSMDGGATWTLITNGLPSIGYNTITYGKGLFVALKSGSNETAWSEDGGETWFAGSSLPNKNWVDVVWGNGRFIAISDTVDGAYSIDGKNWVATTLPILGSGTAAYRRIAYGQGVFVATRNDNSVAYSEDGILWSVYDVGMSGTPIAFGNPNNNGKFISIGGSQAARDISIGAKAAGRPSVANEQIFEIRLFEPGSGYASAPTITVTDPNNITDVQLDVRVGTGLLANPTFIHRGTGFITATADVNAFLSNGNADFLQDGGFVAVRRLSLRPVPGSNVEFDHLPGRYFKLVNIVSFLGTNDGSYTGFLQLSPSLEIYESPPEGTDVSMRIRFSQVRLTGHDFLDIGTGNFVTSNYPNTPLIAPDQTKETRDAGGGRVFYTATDQDGNFRVGDLFSIEQATGVATLNAEAFNIAGLQELQLGEVTLGGNSASISEFSTDPFFTANSDTIVPTQRAVKAYIESQIGGGGASLNVNSVTAGDIFIGTDQITTVSGEAINIKANVVFKGTVLGLPLAYNYFLR